MLSIVLAIILGIGFTLVAVQNPIPVPISFFGTVYEMPLYIFAALSFLTGVFVSLVFHLVDMISTTLDLSSKDATIHEVAGTNKHLRVRHSFS